MKNYLRYGAALLAALMGAMAIGAGGTVLLLGRDPGYTVIEGLPYYNVGAGGLSLLVTSVLIWRRHAWAMPLAVATFVAHSAVLGALLTALRDTVASESITAMVIRAVSWAVILGLMWAAGTGRSGRD